MVSLPRKNVLAGVLLRNAAAAIGRDCVGTPSMSGSSGTILRNAAHAAVGASPKFLDGSCDLRTSNHSVVGHRIGANEHHRAHDLFLVDLRSVTPDRANPEFLKLTFLEVGLVLRRHRFIADPLP
jgi:hypothetical protein